MKTKTPWPGLLKKETVSQVYAVVRRVELAFVSSEKDGLLAMEKARRHGEVMVEFYDFATELSPHLLPNLGKRGGQALADGMGFDWRVR